MKTPRQQNPRCCYLCGHTYNRRNLIEGWTALNIRDLKTHRFRGTKTIRRICTACMDPTLAHQLVASPGVVGKTLHTLVPVRKPQQLKVV